MHMVNETLPIDEREKQVQKMHMGENPVKERELPKMLQRVLCVLFCGCSLSRKRLDGAYRRFWGQREPPMARNLLGETAESRP